MTDPTRCGTYAGLAYGLVLEAEVLDDYRGCAAEHPVTQMRLHDAEVDGLVLRPMADGSFLLAIADTEMSADRDPMPFRPESLLREPQWREDISVFMRKHNMSNAGYVPGWFFYQVVYRSNHGR